MKTLRKPFAEIPRGTPFRPEGWLRRQLEIQAAGLAGNLDRVWPDVRDSAWIGGTAEGWERVPYWLDGFIDLAWLLDDPGLKERAGRYIDAILARQCADGWLCPCTEEKRGDYDVWSLFLLSKVLTVWERRSGDGRIVPALLRAFGQLRDHCRRHPLRNWGRFRWYESLIAIAMLYRETGEAWLPELAETLHDQGFDYPAMLADWKWTAKETAWTYEGHVVNLAMALRAELLYRRFHPESGDDGGAFGEALLAILRSYHGMAHGHFTGDECLAGSEPIQGTELCSVVEAMFSEELLLAETGNPWWGDQLEKLAFNALPATVSDDMWSHQYVQQTNQIGCRREAKPVWTTNNGEAHLFGLEPHFGCCTANFGQGWPKLATAAFLVGDREIISALPLPGTFHTVIDGVAVTCRLETDYPFHGAAVYTVTAASAVDFTLSIRIPGSAATARIDGGDVPPGRFHRITRRWAGESHIRLVLTFQPHLEMRPNGLAVLWRGPLLFALAPAFRRERMEYERNGVERKYPYCDYQLFAEEPWNYGFADTSFTVAEAPVPAIPFGDAAPGVKIAARMCRIPWRLNPDSCAVAAPLPEPGGQPSAPEIRTLIPYGCARLRMTEMPFIGVY